MTVRTSYTLGFLQPNQISNQRLSSGSYSLSARSNIPFARLLGKGIDKIFTWGETIEVPTGQLCTVSNASFHAGDLFINGGCDWSNRPAAITVPVPLQPFADIYVTTVYPADVRMARRAYLMVDATASDLGSVLSSVIGKRADGSHNTGNQITFEPGAGYQEEYAFAANTLLGPIPLGKRASLGDDSRPQALLTTASVYILTANLAGFPDLPTNAYYVMEY